MDAVFNKAKEVAPPLEKAVLIASQLILKDPSKKENIQRAIDVICRFNQSTTGGKKSRRRNGKRRRRRTRKYYY